MLQGQAGMEGPRQVAPRQSRRHAVLARCVDACPPPFIVQTEARRDWRQMLRFGWNAVFWAGEPGGGQAIDPPCRLHDRPEMRFAVVTSRLWRQPLLPAFYP